MTAFIIIVLISVLTILSGIASYYSYKEKEENNDAAIKWAEDMERNHNVHVALYEDSTGRIVDYKIYKL